MRQSYGSKVLLAVVLLAVLALAGCGTTSSNSGTSSNVCNGQSVTVGGKLDPEAQVLTAMYSALLRNAGCKVTEKLRLGTNQVVDAAIKLGSANGGIDIYPEFTATALGNLGLQSSHNPQTDYQTVKAQYEQKFQITWLALAPLNDTYCLSTTQANATKFHISKISDLVSMASTLKVALPVDGKSILPELTSVYGITFPNQNQIVEDESLTFPSVQHGDADINICYTTSPLISANNFVVLTDDMNAIPAYQPAPIVRDDWLSKAPKIADIFSKLAPKLTTAAIIPLNTAVGVNHESPDKVAQDWLKMEGLLP